MAQLKSSQIRKAKKIELQKELLRIYKLLDEKDEQLNQSAVELKKLKESYDKAQSKIGDLQIEVVLSKQEVKDWQEIRSQLEEDKKRLSEKLEAEGRKIKAITKDQKAELNQASRRLKKMENKNDALRQEITKLEKQVKELEEPDILLSTEPKPNHAFRLDLYYPEDPSKGQLNGKITHLLQQKSTTFKGLDMQEIEGFVNEYIVAKPVPEKPGAPEKEKIAKEQPETSPQTAEKAPENAKTEHKLKTVEIQPDGQIEKTAIIDHNRGFRTWLNFDSEFTSIEATADLFYQFSISAYSFDQHKLIELKKAEIPVLARNTIGVYVTPFLLSPGPHRIQVKGQIQSRKDNKAETIQEFEQSRFCQVF